MHRSIVASVLVACCAAQAKEMRIPDACQGPVCIVNLVWKKGAAGHTLTGTIATKKPIQVVALNLNFQDDKKSGSADLVLNNITSNQTFYFKVNSTGLVGVGIGINWERSSLRLTVSAIHGIAPVERNGVTFRFGAQGSRLKVELENKSTSDLILDYSLLTMTAGAENHKLNGIGGKYIDTDKPKANALIPAGTTHRDELVPIEAVKFINAQWNEAPIMNVLLTMPDVTMFIPLSRNGSVQLERIPLEVDKTELSVNAKVAGQ